MHIKDILHDYGPVQSYGLFSFERMNGFLGHLPNKNRLIEPRCFLQEKFNFFISFLYEVFECAHVMIG